MLKLLLTVVVAALFCLFIVGAFSIIVWLGIWGVVFICLIPLLFLSYSFVDEVILGNG
jgi:hypothetical protein